MDPPNSRRPQTGTTPASLAKLSSVRSDMRGMEARIGEAMQQQQQRQNEAMQGMEARIGARMERNLAQQERQNEMNMHTMQQMLVHQQQQERQNEVNMQILMQALSINACRCPGNPGPQGPGYEVADRMENLEQHDLRAWPAAPVRTSAQPRRSAPGDSAPGGSTLQERAHEFESPDGKVGGAKDWCKACHQHRSVHPSK